MFRAAAVGDSVMWGQGLARHEKYAFRYIKNLRDRGIDINLRSEDFPAHSGATIGNYSEFDTPSLVTERTVNDLEHFDEFYGEVPSSFPTILKQLDELENPENIDFLLINGGPNDIGITNAITIRNKSFDELVERMMPLLQQQLPRLLKKAKETAPHANIVYTGYYPALSSDSRIPLGVILQFPNLSFISPILFALSIWTLKEFNDNKKQVERFHLFMLVEMARQVAKFNLENDGSILFCPSGISTKNAMYTGDNYVFELKENRDEEVDEARKVYCSVIERRIEEARIEGDEDEVENFSKATCNEAYFGHPNPKGADKYVQQLGLFADAGFEYSLKNHMNHIGSHSSVREAFSGFGFGNNVRLRQLSDLQRISIITVQIDLHITQATTDTFFPEKLNFDFGWGKTSARLYKIPAYRDHLAILDLKGTREMKKLTKVRMYLGVKDFMRFTMKVTVGVNGYEIVKETINQTAFKKSGGSQFWEHKL